MASLEDIKVNINVDTTDFIKKLRQLQEIIKMDNVRTLKGYSENEQKELEYSKGNMSCNNFLHNITYFPACAEFDSIKDKYDKANTDERISIIRDILDFYTGKAKFPEQKYYIKMPKVNYPYLIRDMGGKFDHAQSPDILGLGSDENSFTEQEIKDIDPRYMAFAVPVEED